mmetsp:Transcript_1579/g.1860  ORF Transcript_1579/g.1860 Transcript_1579/m.1860 type:complete len:308 (+) Transcript_1579:145-1068(+)
MDFLSDSWNDPVSLQDLLMSKTTWKVQLLLLLIQTLAWKVILQLLAEYFLQIIKTRPWGGQYVRLFSEHFQKTFGIKFPDDTAMLGGAGYVAVMCQHITGGLLCVPSVFSLTIFPEEVAFALARHGAMAETAWEVGDMITRIYKICFTEDGRRSNPASLIFILALHHVVGILLVLPLNVYFGNSKLYHEGIFLLQGAAGVAICCQCYGFTLNLKKDSDLTQIKLISTFVLTVMIYSRFYRFGALGIEVYYILKSKYELEHLIPFYLLAMGAMSLFNLLLIVDAVSKFSKYCLRRIDSIDEGKKVKAQ